MTDAWNLPLLEDDEPTPYGPKDKPAAHPRNAKGVTSRPNTVPSANRDGGNWSTLPITDEVNPLGAPPLDWWEIPWEAVCDRIIRAMVPESVCRTCGEPRRRIVGEPEYVNKNTGAPLLNHDGRFTSRAETDRTAIQRTGGDVPRKLVAPGYDTTATAHYPTLGFSDCGHDDWRPGLVLDPFGIGVTAEVANALNRDGIEIQSPDTEPAKT